MNTNNAIAIPKCDFLNGVCRHEPHFLASECLEQFLNGVCRHEQGVSNEPEFLEFLNGVCRHEPPFSPQIMFI